MEYLLPPSEVDDFTAHFTELLIIQLFSKESIPLYPKDNNLPILFLL